LSKILCPECGGCRQSTTGSPRNRLQRNSDPSWCIDQVH